MDEDILLALLIGALLIGGAYYLRPKPKLAAGYVSYGDVIKLAGAVL